MSVYYAYYYTSKLSFCELKCFDLKVIPYRMLLNLQQSDEEKKGEEVDEI